jgi:hypothetical protein
MNLLLLAYVCKYILIYIQDSDLARFLIHIQLVEKLDTKNMETEQKHKLCEPIY